MAAANENENGNGQGFEDLLDNEGTTAGALVLTAFMTTATQPLTCVRLLMQVIVDVLYQIHLLLLPLPALHVRANLPDRNIRFYHEKKTFHVYFINDLLVS